MTIEVVLAGAVALSIAFHFVGVYADAKKTVWIMLVLVWAGAISIATSEVKPKGYEEIKKMQGQFADTDAIIAEAMPVVTVYEMIGIKKSFATNSPKK